MRITSGLNSRLGWRLVGWFLLLSLIPLLVSNWIGYRRSYGIIEGLLDSTLDAVAEVQVSYIQSRIGRQLLYLEAVSAETVPLAASLQRAGGTPGREVDPGAARLAMTQYLDRQLDENRIIHELFFLSPDGELIVSTGSWEGIEGGVSLSDEGPTTTTRLGSSPMEPPALILAVPVRTIEGRRLGSLGGIVPPGRLSELFDIPPHVGSLIVTFILDEQFRPIFVSNPIGPGDYSRPLVAPPVSVEAYSQYTNREGIEVVGKVSPIPGYPWHLLVEEPAEQAFGTLQALRRASMYLGGFFALLVIASAWFVSREIVEPIRRLVHATSRLGRGDLGVRVERHGRDEIAELASAFNDMAQDLAHASDRVSELHQIEIERAQQLATVGELASGLAHEIKNPVIGISNGLDLLKRRVRHEPKFDLITDEMSRELGRIDNAIGSLLAFARPPEPDRSPTDANRIAMSAMSLVQPSAAKEGITVRLEAEPGLPPLVADAEMLRQALVNLLVNAVQATTEGGEIRLSTERYSHGIRFVVQDTGPGIPRDRLDTIFRPFFTTRHAGTGLGLSISRKIVEQHGGRITAESELGRGTTFRIEVPLEARTWSGADLGTKGVTPG